MSSYAIFLAFYLAVAAAQLGSGPFKLNAYGSGISGLTVFSDGKYAYVGNYESWESEDAAPLILTPIDDTSLTGTPDTNATGGSQDWSGVFYVPTSNSTSRQVGLLSDNSDDSDAITAGFFLYGKYFLQWTEVTHGEWYAVASDTDGVWLLTWDDDTPGAIALTARAFYS